MHKNGIKKENNCGSIGVFENFSPVKSGTEA